ncbi:MAG: DUF45 domain-containing protein [Bacilli bacterium]|nr:DUF45 domain-containing protein [Bacilli bacterium]
MQLLLLKNLGIDYVLKLSKAQPKKGLRIAVSFLRNGKLSIRYSKGIKPEEIEAFIAKNLVWIKTAHQKQLKPVRLFVQGEDYLYLGKSYALMPYVSRHETVIINGGQMHLYAKNASVEAKKKVVEVWKTKQCEMVFQELLYQGFQRLQKKMTQFPQLQIKNYKSRWGCCYPQKNLIILNRALIHVPIELILYVIMHELVHLLYPNHSAEFHNMLASLVPDERAKKRQLSQFRPDYQ